MGYLEKPVDLIYMFLDCRRKPDIPEETYTCPGKPVQMPRKKVALVEP